MDCGVVGLVSLQTFASVPSAAREATVVVVVVVEAVVEELEVGDKLTASRLGAAFRRLDILQVGCDCVCTSTVFKQSDCPAINTYAYAERVGNNDWVGEGWSE